MLGRIHSWLLCSCNSSLALCAAEMLAFEANGEGNVGSQQRLWERDIIQGKETVSYSASNNSVQELRLDDTLNSLRSETSAICLPAIFSIFLVVMETTRHSLVIGQLSKRRLM